LEWLHQGCVSDLAPVFFNFGADDFSFEFPFQNDQVVDANVQRWQMTTLASDVHWPPVFHLV
jgi:hypothetical protein